MSTAAPARRVKDQRLRELLSGFSSAIVAFSGGVDSAYLSVVATQVLGSGALCVTADSPSYPEHHRSLARQVAGAFALRHEIVATAELERPEYRANPVNRCYYCKHELYSTLTALASARAIDVVLDGNNADDRGDYRPGRQAAREHGVRSPLDEVGLTKRRFASCRAPRAWPRGTSPRRPVCRRASRTTTRSPTSKLRMVEQAETRCASSASASAACATTTRWRGSSSGATRSRARSIPGVRDADRPRAARDRLPPGDGRSAGVSHGQPE